jgi:hypothetical protein
VGIVRQVRLQPYREHFGRLSGMRHETMIRTPVTAAFALPGLRLMMIASRRWENACGC